MGMDMYMLSWDTETTGVSTDDDRIVTADLVLVDPVGNLTEHWEYLINPGVEIPEGAAAVHGISTEYAREHGENAATSIYEIASILAHYMNNGVPAVAYNASFDFSILNSECIRHLGYDFFEFFPDRKMPPLVIDPFVLDRKFDPWRKGKRTLTAVATQYGVDLENAHASYDDCVAAVQVLHAIWDKKPILAEASLKELFRTQKTWYRQQQQGLMDHFRKMGKDTSDFNTDWPFKGLDIEC